MVDASSTYSVNKAQLNYCVGLHNLVFIKLLNIKKYHHFRFSKDQPGKVYFTEFFTSPQQSRMLLKNPKNLPLTSVLPSALNPEGLSRERKEFLFKEIRKILLGHFYLTIHFISIG
ncbi:hypothetical protein P5673_030649 [Acropora cervicornis]|uniref:Uncharacterized protein n=1 Tax=Acropora cervicornis TaxID=6130 RepID=A0AAD9UTG5_ACRCE|nr:hypothetical protein P5673_030649 [Acropora cervicornis]